MNEELEEEKLKLEIKELNKTWFKKPSYLRVLLPSLIALGSVFYAFQSDLISVQREKNQLKKMQLDTTLAKFEARKNILSDTLLLLKETRDSLIGRIDYIGDYYDSQIMGKAYESIDLVEEIENKKDVIKRLKSSLKKYEFNIKIVKSAPFLSQSTKNALSVWEEKKMKHYTDSLIRLRMKKEDFRESKKLMKKMERKDSVVKEYSSIHPKENQ